MNSVGELEHIRYRNNSLLSFAAISICNGARVTPPHNFKLVICRPKTQVCWSLHKLASLNWYSHCKKLLTEAVTPDFAKENWGQN
jgi:hypothetical protein